VWRLAFLEVRAFVGGVEPAVEADEALVRDAVEELVVPALPERLIEQTRGVEIAPHEQPLTQLRSQEVEQDVGEPEIAFFSSFIPSRRCPPAGATRWE